MTTIHLEGNTEQCEALMRLLITARGCLHISSTMHDYSVTLDADSKAAYWIEQLKAKGVHEQ